MQHAPKTLICLLALGLALVPAAQAQTRPESLPIVRLPDPPVEDDAPASAFVNAARTAIALGRAGEAMEAIERAESRVLIRSVRPSRAGTPSDQALVRTLAEARGLLRQGLRAEALEKLAEVAANPALDAPVE
jgi:hypothetical protein